MKFFVHIVPEHPQKEISLMFGTETAGPSFVQKLKWGGHGPPGHPNGYAPDL